VSNNVAAIVTAASRSKFCRKLTDGLVTPRRVDVSTLIDAPLRPRFVQPMSQQSLIAVNIVNYAALGRKHLRLVADLCFLCLNYSGQLCTLRLLNVEFLKHLA
jgi:hypothetical protein